MGLAGGILTSQPPNGSFPYLYGLQSLANTTEDVYTPLLKEF